MDTEYEQVLLVKPDVFIYRIPPKAAGRAYRASDWKLDEPDWTGRLRLVVKGNQCTLNIEDKQSGQLFAKCFIDQYPGSAIESVADSSRYFVIKIKNEKDGRMASIGMGFADRGDSFDLNVALQDHFKRIEKQEEIQKGFGSEEIETPMLDLGFKEGQTIKVNLNIGKKSSGATNRPRPKAGMALNPGILPPPPTGLKMPSTNKTTSASPATKGGSFFEQSVTDQPIKDDTFQPDDAWSQPTSSVSKSSQLLLNFDDLSINKSNNKEDEKEDNEDVKWSDFTSHNQDGKTSWENF